MKTVSKIFQYAYLVFGVLMAYQAFDEYQNGGARVWFYALFAVGAVAMFFFKRHFNKKFRN